MAGASQSDVSLREVRVHQSRRRDPQCEVAVVPKMAKNNFVYVNSAFVGSTNNVHGRAVEPPTSVVREQYWACSKWPYGQRILAIAVGILLGAVIGMAVSLALGGSVVEDGVGGLFRTRPAPD